MTCCESLREDVDVARNTTDKQVAYAPDAVMFSRARLMRLADAAESTLPKTKTVWDISGSGRSSVPYQRDDRAFSAASVGVVVDDMHANGYTRITIVTRSVPV